MTTTPMRECVIVVMDASKSKGSMEALDWALKNVVRPRDTILVLGVLYEFFSNKLKNSYSCFPFKFLMGIGISGIWERLDFVGQGQMNPRELEEEFEEKRALYQSNLQPFYRQCKKLEVKLDVKLAAGFSTGKLTVEEAQNSNARWIVLDCHFKKDKLYIYEHVSCNVALIKGKDLATLMPSKESSGRNSKGSYCHVGTELECMTDNEERELSLNQIPPLSPCWYPLSWRSDFPRRFSHDEIEAITKGFSDESVLRDDDDIRVYQGLLQETPVLVKCFKESNRNFWSMLKILTKVRHRNIINLVGYCCTGDLAFMLLDFPCKGSVATSLQRDEFAQKLGWRARWWIAQEIGGSLRYLHEECVDGPIIHNSICSSNVVFSRGCSAMLGNFRTAKWLREDDTHNEELPAECSIRGEDERFCFDVHDYGMFLLELITGKSASHFEGQEEGHTLIDWGLPILENGFLCQLMDSRLKESDGTGMAHHMAHAALHCLKIDSNHKVSISEAIGIVRGDTRGTCNHWNLEKHPGDCSCPK